MFLTARNAGLLCKDQSVKEILPLANNSCLDSVGNSTYEVGLRHVQTNADKCRQMQLQHRTCGVFAWLPVPRWHTCSRCPRQDDQTGVAVFNGNHQEPVPTRRVLHYMQAVPSLVFPTPQFGFALVGPVSVEHPEPPLRTCTSREETKGPSPDKGFLDIPLFSPAERWGGFRRTAEVPLQQTYIVPAGVTAMGVTATLKDCWSWADVLGSACGVERSSGHVVLLGAGSLFQGTPTGPVARGAFSNQCGGNRESTPVICCQKLGPCF